MKPLRFYADPTHIEGVSRKNLTDILRAHWNDLSPAQRAATYGIRYTGYDMVTEVSQADLVLLPLKWGYYLERRQVDRAERAVSQAHRLGKPVVIFSDGDFTANVPFSNVIVVECCGYRSRRGLGGNHIWGKPAFVGDLLVLYQQGNLALRQKGPRPVVGFCGQAGGSVPDFMRRYASNRVRWILYRAGIRPWEPAPFETTLFRKRVLDRLERSSAVETNFIRRSRYRAGYWAEEKNPFHPTRLDFIRNILNTDYTVCVRGGGNFSVRLYEALCLGRIPILVDTDCVLPFDDQIDYRRYCVWVDQAEIPSIAEKVADFHAALSPDEFVSLQQNCRKLWEEYLDMNAYYSRFRCIVGQLVPGDRVA